jgi:hypothetical protein
MPQEGSGLNRSVRSAPLSLAANRATRATTELTVAGGPKVRIHLPPADSPSLSRSHFRASRTPAFRAGVRGWIGDWIARDAQGFPLRANRRVYLCRATFQYRSAANGVGDNATTVRTKSGVAGA